MTTELTRRRREAALDADLNVARIADALEAIAAAVGALLEPEPGDERKQDDGPDDAPSSPEDAAAWRPVRGGRAFLDLNGRGWPGLVVVDRLYQSEGADIAVAVAENGAGYTVAAGYLSEPRS